MMKKKMLKVIEICSILFISALFFRSSAFAGWTTMSSGTTDSIEGIWGSSSSNVYAVTDIGEVLHYNGSAWSSETKFATVAVLYDIWGTGPNDIYGVGGMGSTGSIINYNGTSWSSTNSGLTNWLIGVHGTTSSDVFAVGYNGDIKHYNGTSWSAMTSGSTELIQDIWVNSASDAFAVGNSSTIHNYNGTSWSPMSVSTPEHFHTVYGFSGSDVFAAGTSGTILHYNGTTWSTMTSGTTKRILDLWGSSNTDIFAVCENGAILHYNGTSWNSMTSGTTEYLNSVWGSSGSNVFATGANGIILHYDGVPATSTTTTAASTTTTTASTGGNTAPIADFFVDPPEGDVNTEFMFNAEPCTDAEDLIEALEVRWDFESDGVWDTEYDADKIILHKYEVPDLYPVTLEVLDTGGLTNTITIEVMVFESPSACPFVQIYGENNPKVEKLRRFRDNVLMKSEAGKAFVRAYYKNSSKIAEILKKHPMVMNAAEKVIDAVLKKVE